MKKYQLVFCIVIMGLLSGCTNLETSAFGNKRYRTMEDSMASWIGAQESELVGKWGAPKSSYENRDGTRILTWGTYNETTYYYGTCNQSYLIDLEGIVSKWGYSGYCRGMAGGKGLLPKSEPIPSPTL